MKHVGDITKLNGAEIPPVDIITGGSPCQDLSVAGKRAGLAGERSGLFMEQIRIIKEMRNAKIYRESNLQRTDNVRRYPRFMVWENVAGAFSSNGGEDFRAVLEETARVVDENADIPRLAKGQRWPHSGAILGDGYSIAWRLHDAQYWGVPQRRKRVALVADFGGESAPKILFDTDSLSRDSQESRGQRKNPTGATQGITNKTGDRVKPNQPILLESNQNHATIQAVEVFENHSQDTRYRPMGDVCQTVSATYGMGGNNQPFVVHKTAAFRKTSHARNANDGQGWEQTEINDTLNIYDTSQTRTPTLISQNLFVRRLTPLECERLQGYPDGWTDIGDWVDSKGKKHKGDADSPRYKALGNSIALPFWEWLAIRMLQELGEDHPTMGSLFDGIGGFPLVYSRHACEPVWASEIEEFPIAVTKKRFPESKP